MGAYWSSVRRAVGWTKEIQVILVGLDNAGKTSVLYRMQLGQVLSTMPTIGFSNERLTYGDMKIHALDIGGQTTLRQFWNSYYKHTDVVLFVVDGTDTDRMATCRNELMQLVSDPALANSTIAILVNKCDAAHYQPIQETKQMLSVGTIKQKHCRVFETSALTGDGLSGVLDWITERMRAHGYVR